MSALNQQIADQSPRQSQGQSLIQVLNPNQLTALQAAGSGLSQEQLIWASGYLAGLAGSQAPAVTAEPGPTHCATILYASETGNGRAIAQQLGDQIAEAGLLARVVCAEDFRPSDLTRERFLYLVASTHGEGDPPQEAEALFRYLARDRAPRLEQLQYSVLALGDRSYEQYCEAGRWLDERLSELGATPLSPRIDCDVDYQSSAQEWSQGVLELVQSQQADGIADNGPSNVVPLGVAVPQTQSNPQGASRENPLTVEVLAHSPLTSADAPRQVHHLELGFEPGALEWQPGDALGVIHRNPPETIERIIAAVGAAAEDQVTVADAQIPLYQALTEKLEITGLHLGFVQHYAEVAQLHELDQLLQDQTAVDRRQMLVDLQIIDVLNRWPARLNAQDLVNGMRPLSPRLFSIASAPEATADEIHLTVALLEDEKDGLPRQGAASSFLCRNIDEGESVQVYVHQNNRFRLPEDDQAPVIMVGAGTGIAPFRAFIEARSARGAQGANWLMFGNRFLRRDFLYQIEWLRHRKNGLLQRLDVAFSRDPKNHSEDSRYVQDLIGAQAQELRKWVDQGAYLYVCGSIAMGSAVEEALTQVLGAAAGRSDSSGDPSRDMSVIEQLKDQGRYQRDVY